MTGDNTPVSEWYWREKPVSHTFINPDSIFIHGSGVNCGPCNLLRRYGELFLNGDTPPVGMHIWGDRILHQLQLKIKIAYDSGERWETEPAFDPPVSFYKHIPGAI
jgi:hypothetical protein